MSSWELALEDVAKRLNHRPCTWALVGSAATAVRGVKIEPGDLDILMASADGVRAAAATLPNRRDRWPDDNPHTWRSSVEQQVLTYTDEGLTRWTFGRWSIDGTKVEVAHLASEDWADAFIETGGGMWSSLEVFHWHGIPLPVVAIELQIGTMIVRDQQDRLNAVFSAIETHSLRPVLLRRTLKARQIDTYDEREIMDRYEQSDTGWGIDYEPRPWLPAERRSEIEADRKAMGHEVISNDA